MSDSRFAAAGVALLLAVGGTSLAACSSNEDSSAPQTTESQTTGTTAAAGDDKEAGGGDRDTAGGPEASAQPGSFVDYSPELVSSTPGDKLLFFHAPWCSQCVALEEDIEASGVPDGVTISKVDYDSNQDLRQEYGVTIQTTIVKVDDNGEKVESYVAYEDPTLDNVTAALLQ